jgi:hypothetical protein
MPVPRDGPAVALLRDGRVLVLSGIGSPAAQASAEFWDPARRAFTPAAGPHHPRESATATTLPDGTVLVVGGLQWGTSTEIFDPVHDTWTDGPSLSVGRYAHTATLLTPNAVAALTGMGEVVVTGGMDDHNAPIATTEVYDTASHLWRRVGDLRQPRYWDTATALPDGRLVVTGGQANVARQDLASAEIFDPVTGQWSTTGSMNAGRECHAAALLPDGRVLVAGGWDGSPVTARSELLTLSRSTRTAA